MYGRLRRVVAVAGALAVGSGLMTAVSNGGSASAATDTSPIKIGVICSCTGPLAASISVGPPAYQAWASTVNAQGGINGHKIQVIVKDDATNPGTSLQEAESLVGQSHVIALVDGSDVDATWATYAQQNKVPVIGMASSSEPFFTNSDFFAEGQTEDQLFASIVGAAKKTKAKSLALFYCAEAATCQEGVAPLKTTAKALGVPLVYDASISASAPNYTAQCLAAKQSGADALFIADGVTVIQTVASECSKQGYTPAIVIDGESLAPAFKTVPGLTKNTIFENLNMPFFASTPGIAAMNTAFKKYQPDLLKSKNFNEIAVQGWVSGLLFAAAAKAGNLGVNGSPTSAQLLTGLYTMKGATLNGMAPPLTFVAGQPNPVDCWLSYAVLKGGKFSSPYGLKSICAKS